MPLNVRGSVQLNIIIFSINQAMMRKHLNYEFSENVKILWS